MLRQFVFRSLVLAFVALVPGSMAFGQPSMVSYQGSLMKGPGDVKPAYTGNASFKFAILCGGQIVWNNDAGSPQTGDPSASINVDVNFGIFNVMLGDQGLGMPALTGDILEGCTTPTLRVWVDTGDGFEQMPDQPMASAAYALSAGESGFVSLHHTSLLPIQSTVDWVHDFTRGAYISTMGTGLGLYAPIQLPDGATITSMTSYYTDFSSTTDVIIELKGTALSNGGQISMGLTTSSGSAGAGQASDDVIINNLIDNSTRTYYILARLTPSGSFWEGSDLAVMGVTIAYHLP